MDGVELFHKYLAKHHLEMDFSQLDMEEVEKEVLVDRPSEVATEEVLVDCPFEVAMEGEVELGVVESIPTDPFPSSLPREFLLLSLFFVRKKKLSFLGLDVLSIPIDDAKNQ